ncbi:PREDICTED: odorant receptor 4-like [Papilio xuthus]|uniref:Odorant receptor n=1 Tax=Papilio xuthus TaxID=66420 RepID=A0AAJ7E9W4_PAPXU|nr:PREDICTED: odorant receptor 4-like [Papilio xuthus]WCC57699.1 odorant receptor 49 [Papilio xuthus]
MDETVQTFNRVLCFAGISFFSKTNQSSKRWFLFQILNFIYGFVTVIFSSAFVIVNFNNMLLCIQGACIWTTGVIMCTSLGLCLFFKRKFQIFLNEMVFKDSVLDMPLIVHVLESNNSGRLKDLRDLVLESEKKFFRFSRILLKTYIVIGVVCVTLYLCCAIYQMITSNDNTLRLLAFEMWFPWSLENFKVYVATFIFQAYSSYLCCIANPGLQSIIILLVSQTIRQLTIITFILENLNELSIELTDNKENWQYCCTDILSQCFKRYVKIKRFINHLNAVCQPFYLTLILVAMMLVGMCSVKIAVSNKFSADTMKYYVHNLYFILTVLMICVLGQQVENECEKLELAITEKWYLFDKKHKTGILIFKMAVNKGMPMYIFGSTRISLPTFTWFIKTGMSFFTLVMSVLEG